MECCGLGLPNGGSGKKRRRNGLALTAPSNDNTRSPPLDPFQLLQVRRDATDRELLASYRNLALLYHPARSVTNEVWLFTAVAAAYETLSDDETRHAIGKLLDLYAQHQRESMPDLVTSNSSTSTTLDDTQHYSEETTELLFGGPLQLMYQARRFEAFTDAFELFEQIFGSSLGTKHYANREQAEISRKKNEDTRSDARLHHSPQQQPAYRGRYHSSNTRVEHSSDGTTTRVSCTTRHSGNRCLTRTVRQSNHHMFVSVTSTEVLDERDDVNDLVDPWLFCCAAGL